MRFLCFLLVAIFCFWACPSQAHFGMIIPSKSMVISKKDALLNFNIAFSHPFSQKGMAMAKPAQVLVKSDSQTENLVNRLAPITYLGEPAFSLEYEVARPGVYQFAVTPEPYYEASEDCYIIHYAKTIVGAYGYEDGWEKGLGLPIEIVPLSRPFGNYSGNVFSGLVLKDGKPLANAEVEIEYLNDKGLYEVANNYFETQLVRADANGVFVFGIPWPGWWGFAALTEANEKIKHDGQPKPVELGGIIWLEFSSPQKRQ